MAYLEFVSATDTSITLRGNGFTNPATSTYYSLIQISKTTSPTVTNAIWGSVNYGTAGNYYTGNVTFTGLSAGTSYSFRMDVTPSGSTMQSFYLNASTTGTAPDNTAPTISITSYSGTNAITINWTASDNVALRATSTYALYISGKDNSTLSFVQYVNLGTNTFTFQKDSGGNIFASGSVYLVRVVAIDTSSNTALAERYVTVTKTRPSNFAWTYSKTSGADINIYASEWNRLIDTINEFREYKGFTRFTTIPYASSGQDITASYFNQISSAIGSMSPPSSPQTVASGYDIYASQFNNLRDSLNSIT